MQSFIYPELVTHSPPSARLNGKERGRQKLRGVSMVSDGQRKQDSSIVIVPMLVITSIGIHSYRSGILVQIVKRQNHNSFLRRIKKKRCFRRHAVSLLARIEKRRGAKERRTSWNVMCACVCAVVSFLFLYSVLSKIVRGSSQNCFSSQGQVTKASTVLVQYKSIISDKQRVLIRGARGSFV